MDTITNVSMHVTLNPEVLFQEDYAKAFNAWMDDYMNDPKAFEKVETLAMKHLQERFGDVEPTYGQLCTSTLFEYLKKTKEEK